jgi:hypothetical protein
MRRILYCALLVLAFAPAQVAHAGVTNPDISVIGQPLLRWTDAVDDPARKRPVFNEGETEFVFDAALNPYARGFFALSFAEGEAGVEEGYFSLLRGLPGDINIKGGKYRVGFGKLNAVHPHAYPFAERFGVLAAYLPGTESFNETGLDVSYRLPLPGTWSVTASGDVLQGDSFRIAREAGVALNDPLLIDPEGGDHTSEPRSAWVGRLAAFAPVGDRSGVELGFTATGGTNNVAARARTQVLGGDVKAKLWSSANAYLLVQGEYLHLERDDAGWDEPTAVYALVNTTASGGYLFADYNWAQRYNLGASFEKYEDPSLAGETNTSVGLFTGLALMEETTAFRLDWRRLQPGRPVGATRDPDAVNQLTLRVIFSMGPHKAHQF